MKYIEIYLLFCFLFLNFQKIESCAKSLAELFVISKRLKQKLTYAIEKFNHYNKNNPYYQCRNNDDQYELDLKIDSCNNNQISLIIYTNDNKNRCSYQFDNIDDIIIKYNNFINNIINIKEVPEAFIRCSDEQREKQKGKDLERLNYNKAIIRFVNTCKPYCRKIIEINKKIMSI